MSKLVLVKPLVITPAMLISSSVPETDHPVWVVGTTYALGARVIILATNKIYQSLQGTNLGKDPITETAWWIVVSATNRWKLFDTSNSTQTTQATSMSYTLRPGISITDLAILNVKEIISIRVRFATNGITDYDSGTVNLPSLVGDSTWWGWFFSTRSRPKRTFTIELPNFPNADIIVDVVGSSGLAVGVLIIGQRQELGLGVQKGVRLGIQDYSRKERNEFGDTVLVQRAFARRASFNMLLDNSTLDSAIDILSDVRATPCLWMGIKDYDSTIIYGFFKEFEVVITYSNYSDCSIEIEGLT